ncbi:MAG TPA: hypothetical protein VD838_21170 [Anaeromyxobacteraceae bacterium]|nr:hypothetical protein [Anaeromyxobacteraceae bacterium]
MARSDRLSQHEHRQQAARKAIEALVARNVGGDLGVAFSLIHWISGAERGVGTHAARELREILDDARPHLSAAAFNAVRDYVREIEQ